ncbi:hypothetical protein ACF0H5_017542 [Mactra antiquata]
MAYLLGAAAVMESLQTDVRDVQSCVVDVMSRIGPVQCTSWKFPDKSATDLDIEDLLDLYSYSDDEEERQVAHIALYELVIDRLVLLLHTMASYTEGISKIANIDQRWKHVTGSSVGVVTKQFCSRLCDLQQVVKHTVQEKNTMSRKVMELEGDVKRLDAELKQAYASNRPKTAGFGGLIPPNRAEMITGMSLNPSQLKEFGLISKDEYNKSCQTSETAFTPCDSCSMVQKSFRQCGEIVVSICQQQQVPSCLQKFRPQVSHLDWLSGNDVKRWGAEVLKDLQRISKLTATIKPLKEELTDCRDKIDKLEKRVKNFDRDLKKEKDDRTALHKQYEAKIKEMEHQHTQTLELEQQQKDLLEMNKKEVESLLEKCKNELQEKQSSLTELKHTKIELEKKLNGKEVNSKEIIRLKTEVSNLEDELNNVKEEMTHSSKELQKEVAKSKSVSKHNQNLQSKQESLLIRIEVLDDENKELKDQLSEMEEEKDQLDESLNESKRETTQLAQQLKEKQNDIEHIMNDKESLEQTISTLETTVESLNDKLEEAKERERLIVEYPDINGPVNPDLSGTGDILLDMENQVKANNIRIQLLETQNNGLRNSIRKLQSMQEPQDNDIHDDADDSGNDKWATYVSREKPQPLWNPNSVQIPRHEPHYTEPEYFETENLYNQSSGPGKFNNQTGLCGKFNNQSGLGAKFNNQSGLGAKLNNQTDEVGKFHNQSGFQGSKLTSKKTGTRPTSASVKKQEEFVVGKAMRPDSAKVKRENTSSSLGRGQGSSGTFMTPVNSNSISAYLQLKKAGKLNLPKRKPDSRPTTGKTVIPTTDMEDDYIRGDSFSCQNCDKMYNRQKDLDIHMSYCTG